MENPCKEIVVDTSSATFPIPRTGNDLVSSEETGKLYEQNSQNE